MDVFLGAVFGLLTGMIIVGGIAAIIYFIFRNRI